ncbi:MAG: hypothetical protein LBL90_10420 [Prevotellaceae bacterium]|jgi:tyrosine-protein phosphatase YwqE|nr:hypothetical protein [Prevotellaceae bacterium]
MFGLFRKSIISSGILNNFTDIHTHIMYGVDDGMRTIEESFAALDFYEKQNVKRVYFTPHIMEDLPNNTPEFLNKRFEKIKSVYNGALELKLGAEYMLDSSFAKQLDNGLLTILDNKVLLETYTMNEPVGFESALYAIQKKGYDVLLAHPERYSYMTMNDYLKFKRQGIYIQLNILSLLGAYGHSAKIKAQELLHNNMYDFVGSDMHSLGFHSKKYQNKGLKNREADLLSSLVEKNNR